MFFFPVNLSGGFFQLFVAEQIHTAYPSLVRTLGLTRPESTDIGVLLCLHSLNLTVMYTGPQPFNDL